MMYLKNTKKIILNKNKLEDKLKIKIKFDGKNITIEGKVADKFFAEKILEAIDFGFDINEALNLLDIEFIFEKLNIKNMTRKKNLEQVRARIIGTQGKTLKTLCELSNCNIKLIGNELGIISPCEEIKNITLALNSLIRGAKQANVYSFLEKHQPKEILDFGLKEFKKKKRKTSRAGLEPATH